MTLIEGAACLPEVPAGRTSAVISDPFVTMPEGPLWVQAVPDGGALGVTAVGAGSASERLPCSWRRAGHQLFGEVYLLRCRCEGSAWSGEAAGLSGEGVLNQTLGGRRGGRDGSNHLDAPIVTQQR